MNAFVLVSLLSLGGALASPAAYDSVSNDISLQQRESQLLSIAEGFRQFSSLLSEVYARGSSSARSLKAQATPSNVARALRENDPIELALNTIELDTEPCRQRLVCELQSTLAGYRFGGMAYELIKSRVPALEQYGYVSTGELGVKACRQAFPCQFAASPLMERARQMRSLAFDYCDIEGDSYTSRVCRAVTYTVDTLETL